jgi:integrase
MTGLKLHRQNDLFFSLKDGSYISYYLFQKKLRLCIENIGLNPDLFSTHSFRRGFATLAFRSNISPESIKLIGDWKSDAFVII